MFKVTRITCFHLFHIELAQLAALHLGRNGGAHLTVLLGEFAQGFELVHVLFERKYRADLSFLL